MKCENCKEKDAIKYSKYSTGKFCSIKCAHGFSTKAKRKEINEKVSKTLKSKYPKKIRKCESCDTIISSELRNRYCDKCFLFTQNIILFEKLGIKEKNLQIANKKTLEILTTEYFKNKKSLQEIYEKYNIRFNTVFWFFKKNNINLRNNSKAGKNAVKVGRLIQPENNSYKCGHHITWFGKDVFLRSSYEFKFAYFLDDKQMYYEVESKRFAYKHNNESHTYISDFYIPDLNLIVETKNGYLLEKDKEEIEEKKKVVINSGFNFILISDIGINNLSDDMLGTK